MQSIGASAVSLWRRALESMRGGRTGSWGTGAEPGRPAPGAVELALRLGPDALDASELLALILGPRSPAAHRAASELARGRDLAELARAAPLELARSPGIGPSGALRLAAAFALGRRLIRSTGAPRASLRSAERVHRLMAPELQGLQQEAFHVLLLDGKHRLRRRQRVSLGTLTTSLVHPREVFRPALREAAAAVIAVHNHPSGDPEPSREDLEVTRRLIEVGRLVGVPLVDHLIVGDGRFVSLRERIGF